MQNVYYNSWCTLKKSTIFEVTWKFLKANLKVKSDFDFNETLLKNIRSYQTFLKWYIEPMFDAQFLVACVSFYYLKTWPHFYSTKRCRSYMNKLKLCEISSQRKDSQRSPGQNSKPKKKNHKMFLRKRYGRLFGTKMYTRQWCVYVCVNVGMCIHIHTYSHTKEIKYKKKISFLIK